MRENYFDGLGGLHAHLVGTANIAAQTIIAAGGSGKYNRVKAFRCFASVTQTTPVDLAMNALWLTDGTSNLGLIVFPGLDAAALNGLAWDSGVINLPCKGKVFAANTAVGVDATATSAVHHFMVDVWYDVVDAGQL